MCLDKITKVYKPSLFNLWIPKFAYKSGVGWKEFDIRKDGDLESRFIHTAFFGCKLKPLPINKFLHEKDYRTCGDLKKIKGKTELYDFGWHILPKRPIRKYTNTIIKKVKYKYGHTVGIDATYFAPTIVAKYMKILED